MVQAPPKVPVQAQDNLQIHSHRSWEQFKLIQKGLEHAPRVRLFFWRGTAEILMPGRYHELFKKIIAALIEAFLLDHDIETTPTGSMDQAVDGLAAGQPDESYEIGDYKLAIEIIVTSGDINKLDLYQTLGIHEVWFWEDGLLKLYHLIDGEYQPVSSSHIPALREMDMTVLHRCILMGETNWNQAVKTFRLAHPL